MHCLEAVHICMYVNVCRHVFIRHKCTHALDTARMSQDTYRYNQIQADTGTCISHIHCAYAICIQLLYHVHIVDVCAYITDEDEDGGHVSAHTL